MTTTAERLVSLAGTTGIASNLLQMIGQGHTTGDALVNYSGLSSATAAEHLMFEVISSQNGWGFILKRRRR